MRRRRLTSAFTLCIVLQASAQADGPPPPSTIQVVPNVSLDLESVVHVGPDEVRITNVSAASIVAQLWSLDGGPLLADPMSRATRFNLVWRQDKQTREKTRDESLAHIAEAMGVRVTEHVLNLSGHALRIAPEGIALEPADCESEHRETEQGATAARIVCECSSLDDFAMALRSFLPGPVLNETGATGRYRIDVRFDPRDPSTLSEAINRQCGLELVPIVAPTKAIIVERIEQPPAQPSDEPKQD